MSLSASQSAPASSLAIGVDAYLLFPLGLAEPQDITPDVTQRAAALACRTRAAAVVFCVFVMN